MRMQLLQIKSNFNKHICTSAPLLNFTIYITLNKLTYKLTIHKKLL